MPFAVLRRKYPFLKIAIAIAIVLAGIGLYLLFTHKDANGATDLDPVVLLPWLGGAIVVALLGAMVRRKEAVEVTLPSDHVASASRTEVDGIIDKLDEARAKGELSETRYQKAKAKVLAQAKGKK